MGLEISWSYKKSVLGDCLGLGPVLIVLLVKGAILEVVVISTETEFLLMERTGFDSQVVLYVDGSLDEDHALVVEVVGDDFAVLTLVLKSGILSFLLHLSLTD